MLKFYRITRAIVFLALGLTIGVLAGFRINAWVQETSTVADLRPTNGQLVETSYGKMHVSVWGDKAGKPVILTHGMAAWGGLWTQTAEQLAGAGYQVFAVDQPPFGFSDRDNTDFSRTAQARRIKEMAETLGLRDYLLVGHSYGGGIAMETALLDRLNIAGLVLVCPVMALAPENEAPTLGEVPFVLGQEWLAEALVSVSITNPFLTGLLTKQFMFQKSALTETHIEILQRPMTLKGNTSQMVKWLQQFIQGDPSALSRQRENLASFSKPVALIWGEEDTVTPIALGEELNQILKPVSFERMREIGHMPQLEANEAFTGLLQDALQNVAGKAE